MLKPMTLHERRRVSGYSGREGARSRGPLRRQAVCAVAVALCLLASACGQDDADTDVTADTDPGSTGTSASTGETAPADPGPDAGDEAPAATDPDEADSATGTASQDPAAPDTSTADPAPADDSVVAVGDLPDVAMTDVTSNESVNLQSLTDAQTPLLLWFWVPH